MPNCVLQFWLQKAKMNLALKSKNKLSFKRPKSAFEAKLRRLIFTIGVLEPIGV